jgi:TPP-dependent 2-oxoacid decarboxylase
LHMWRKFSPSLREGDCVIAEVGSAQYGTLELELPANVTFFTQLYYSCIGFTVGALLGALVARREQRINGRVWLFVGDGSLQMTVQVRLKFHGPNLLSCFHQCLDNVDTLELWESLELTRSL